MLIPTYPRLRALAATCAFLAAAALDSELSVATEPSYERDIKPLLAEKCYSCHGVLKQEASLRLETRELMLQGGDSGTLLNLEEPATSLILERVAADPEERMPPEGEGAALTEEELARLQNWIAAGAPAPEEEVPSGPKDHWAFQPVAKPPVGVTIDSLLSGKHEQLGLQPQGKAARSIALRRLYLDLIGLPPSVDQLQDQRPWSVIVDELLANPGHGERWARHWMDVWRYSDNYGLGKQLRYSQKHLWHWRDWIIASLNADKGYDRMILEMLAGDEIAPLDQEAVAATGFLARSYYLFNRTTWLDATIEHTSKAFLGLTMNCAKCHDHKYDPLSQRDYYQFRAIFEPHQVRLDPVDGQLDFEKDGLPRVFDDHIDEPTYLHRRGDPMNPDTSEALKPSVPALLADFQPQVVPVSLPLEAYAPGTRESVQVKQLAMARDEVNRLLVVVQELEEKLEGQQSEPTSEPNAIANGKELEAEFEIMEEFNEPNDLWEIEGDNWKYQDGALVQTMSNRANERVRLTRELPGDFQFEASYVTTGGDLYKSVTFRFDETQDQSFDNFVYTSAHAPGPKVQLAYTRDGKSIYPGPGRSSQNIEIGQRLRLKFAIRGRLANVWLDDKFLLSYQFPERNTNGRFSITAFDSTVRLDRIHIKTLSSDVELRAPKGGLSPDSKSPEKQLELARAELEAARARRTALQAIIEADNSKKEADWTPEDARYLRLAERAHRLQLESQRCEAVIEALVNETKDPNKSTQASKRAAALKVELDAESSSPTYETIRASFKALETPEHKETDYPSTYSSQSTGRRTALARWMIARQNPLTARVAVNHVWMRHMGEPLVETVFDFGLRAPQPLHQDVLDFLAFEFIESGWSFKHVHRLILNSEAYQRTSGFADARSNLERDPNNLYLWRMNSKRMESQLVRDSLLSIGGKLDSTLGGPSLVPGTGQRRSLYFRHSRDDRDKFLATFDDADFLQCYRRIESVLPQQALALSNSKLSYEMAEAIAKKCAEESTGNGFQAFVETAFWSILAKPVSERELAACQQFAEELSRVYEGMPDRQRKERVQAKLVHALINHNDFISVR